MPSIFEVGNYAGGTTYYRNDIVKSGGYFYYLNIQSSVGVTPTVSSSTWGGLVDHNSEAKPEFIWTPSYNLTASVEPKVKSIRFGDGYEQRFADGINNSLLSFDMAFEKRDARESTAILHFLQLRKGAEAFFFTPPEPYSTRKKFVCRSWSSSISFHNNYSIKAVFEEVSR